MNDPQFKRLPRLVAAYARAGWFQVSMESYHSLDTSTDSHLSYRAAPCSSLLVFILLPSVWQFTDDIPAIINYRWSRSPILLADRLEKAIAAVTAATYLLTAAWYASQEDKTTSGLLTIVGGLQTWSAFFARR